MNLLQQIKNIMPLDHPLRILYHQVRSMVAALVFGLPARNMIVIGVTGTDGKTTTCNMIAAVLKAAGFQVGLISTVRFMIDDRVWINETKLTSLDPFMMNKLLWQMQQAGCQYVVLEVSSHALFYQRTWGVNFDVAVMTHISSDHLDLHRTMKNYVETKKKLFKGLNYQRRKPGVPKIAVLNGDDEFFEEFEEIVTDKKYVYGIKKQAQVSGKDIQAAPDKTVFTLQVANSSVEITLPLPGAFNVYNALAALAVGMSQNISVDTAKKALEQFTGVGGRMEMVKAGQPFEVIVDYAHTEDALHQVLSTLRPVVKGRLILVFGCTGDRDKRKRPLMGKMADKYADLILLTDDDPYTENRMAIIQGILPGIERQENEGLWIIPDRGQAIQTAIFLARDDDLVLITGKGAEQVLVTNQGKIPWDDREIAKKHIQARMTL